MRTAIFACALLSLSACTSKSIGLGRGEEVDARLYADVYTWGCAQQDTGGGTIEEWEGVYAYNVTLEYAPDGLTDRSIPATGCSDSLDIFPTDAGSAGYDLPTTPSWYNSSTYGGVFQKQNTGFYSADVFTNSHSCVYPDDLIADGTQISDADVFSGATTPKPGTLTSVDDGASNTSDGLTYGEEVALSWEASGWAESWIQIRREKNGQLVQGLTCRTTGTDSFTIDSSIWSQLSDALEVDVTNVYVAFGNYDDTVTSDGQKIQTWTREMHTAVVQD